MPPGPFLERFFGVCFEVLKPVLGLLFWAVLGFLPDDQFWPLPTFSSLSGLGPVLQTFSGCSGLFWAFSGLLGLFPDFSRPRVSSGPFSKLGPLPAFSGLFFKPFLDFWASPQPIAGLALLGSGYSAVLGLFPAFSAFFLEPFLFWAFSGLLNLFPAFSMPRAAPFLSFWASGLFWASSEPFLSFWTFFRAFCGLGPVRAFSGFPKPFNVFQKPCTASRGLSGAQEQGPEKFQEPPKKATCQGPFLAGLAALPDPFPNWFLVLSWFWWSPSHFWAGFGDIV